MTTTLIGSKPKDKRQSTRVHRKLPKRIGLGIPGRTLNQIPLCEWHESYDCWRIWVHYNPSITAGTYLDLYSNGTCFRVTVEPDGDVISHVLEA